ncbi:2-C-methyl-D-erythritol 2,4-cyclodiphosphate synthase [Prolixibacter denitrificans]|jgi:2-C-methyl-D-erythritol 2,4-cyclodiphosphate synthase|uniref:2-C-methyl-D-erythritol 2,4-cyclodiphosphate synthase n=1 Tax=Prolixibacter denitrificans TaxID=1541063 RepID=A0A2P8C914_9BACT|nr:2-C-methyl-D-erythritol 2,4-cyclodiphosphate synthase [Prolixibacter denitrificans]PSK81452.1 2-C-methyl-D-erythritol 2,4-cyclodiphosphate synthase [Prolixibacter denitrificans]GET21078.1 2-C-methyl-D-erythritol 2,4-cyclodiphosphate synthase [Prolixibacter denitrificans]
MDYRVGLGYDVHRLAEGEELWLGGVRIPHNKGTVAHSDGDVLLHAISDAMLGAARLRDIGFHFPDTSEKYKNADSKVLMAEAYRLVREKGYEIVNIDSTIAAQKPKLMPFIPSMEKKIAEVLEIDEDNVAVKATTTEGLGPEGREESISVQAVVLLQKQIS